ncbi:multidrug and toxin extrusion [Halalkalibacter akibai JCM 9157]|uniref:Multidrug and toxin extrusion n=1 Tax=Halalkalibacter akibai (strain ATCC 43226 / DSM 21942 / CIP 109018 / JCM 9157 / 1139) TaxID=1236973 RepID=W4QZ83_HALA3|nr:multidrug and toxin extrusion [Halalkalibacter akibai JCM 9157]
MISFAPAIGPTLSGWVTTNYEWRYMFYGILPLALLMLILASFKMRNVTELKNPKVDPVSIMLSTFGFGGLLYGFTSAGNNGWGSLQTITFLVLGVVLIFLFIKRQLGLSHPMLEFRVFKAPMFTLATIICSIGFLGLIGLETLIPLYMHNMRGFTAVEAGIVLLPGALITGIMAPITGRIFDRYGARVLAIPGLIIMTFSTFAFLFIDTTTSIMYLTVMYAIRMFGFSMVMMPVNTAGLNQLPRKLLPHGSAVTNTIRQMSASIGTGLLVTTMTTAERVGTNLPHVINPDIFGAIIAFGMVGVLTFVSLILALKFRKPTRQQTKNGKLEARHLL